jgi:hypothetical protein
MVINTVSQLIDELREYDQVGPLAVMLAVIDEDRGMHLEALTIDEDDLGDGQVVVVLGPAR